jgi:hypothetical protein
MGKVRQRNNKSQQQEKIIHDFTLLLTAKSLKYDSAQNALDARREIFEERGVLSVRRSDEEIEATPQMRYFQRNHP